MLKEIAIVDIGIVIDGMEIVCGKTFGFTPEAKRLAEASEFLYAKMIAPILSGRHLPRDVYGLILQEARAMNFQQIAQTEGQTFSDQSESVARLGEDDLKYIK